jgi:hypothetical protein
VPCDTTSAGFTVTLPNAPADLSVVGIKQVIQGGTNTVTVACAGSDAFNKAGGATSGTLTLLAQGMLLQYKSSGAIWYVIADDLALPQLDARYVAQSSLPLAIASGGTGQASKSAAFNALSPNAALGDVTYGSGTNTSTNLAGNTSATKNFLTQTGTGSVSAAPAWGTIASADMPTGTTSAKGALQLDGTASDIAAPATSAAAGGTGKAADAGHVHPLNDPLQIGVAVDFFPGTLTQNASVFTANFGCYMKLISGGYAISNLNIFVGASSGNISVAAYTNSGTGMSAAPTGGRLATSGAIACPAGGSAAVSLGSTVTPNLGDWVALSADNTTATFTRVQNSATTGSLLLPGFGSRQASAHPLPSTPSSLASDASIGNYCMRGS